MGRVEGKVAFITGAGIGQGRWHAVRLAEEGADVVATDFCSSYPESVGYPAATEADLEETRRLVEKTGRRCLTVTADVRRRDDLAGAVQAGLREFGHLDVVSANAGVITFHERSWEIPEETYDLVLDTNLKGVWNTVVSVVPSMIEAKRGGSIIITSSVAGLRGHPLYAHYSASKHGTVGVMRAFANELAPYRIRVNTVHPTGVSSPGMGGGGASPEDSPAAQLFAANPIAINNGVNTIPDLDLPADAPYGPVGMLKEIEISNAVVWLASDESRYVTGQTLAVDAGNTTKP